MTVNTYFQQSARLYDSVAAFSRIHGGRVLEIMAGSGLLASNLRQRGCEVMAVDKRAVGLYPQIDPLTSGVTGMDALEAVQNVGDSYDVLLVSWPETNDIFTLCACAWGCDRPIILIGETPRTSSFIATATDLFFEMVTINPTIDLGYDRDRSDEAVVCFVRPEADKILYKARTDGRLILPIGWRPSGS